MGYVCVRVGHCWKGAEWAGVAVIARYEWRCDGAGCLRGLREQKDKGGKEGKGLMLAGGRGRLVRSCYARMASRTAARQRS